MKKFLKKVCKVVLINWLIRLFLKSMIRISYRWRVSGILDLKIASQKIKLYTECDDHFADIYFYGRPWYEESDLRLFLSLTAKSKIILDIGSNIGIYSITAAKKNPSAMIYSFEPYYFNRQRLQKNCTLNNCTNIFIQSEIVGEFDGSCQFFIPEKERIIDTASSDLEQKEKYYQNELKWKSILLPQITVDSFFQKHLSGKKIDLIKIDVEGAEIAVFNGMKKILAEQNPVILFESYFSESKRQYFNQIMNDFGYSLYLIFANKVFHIDSFVDYGKATYLFAKSNTLDPEY